MKNVRVLIVEREVAVRRTWRQALEREQFNVIEANEAESALQCFRTNAPSAVVLGGCSNAVDVAYQIRRASRATHVILVVKHSSEELAVAALRAGVAGYLKEPGAALHLAVTLHDLMATAVTADETTGRGAHDVMLGGSPAIRGIRDTLGNISTAPSNVLITGETGTGKELLATLIHENSARRHKPFQRINCAAIPDDLLESELFGHARGAFTGAVNQYEGKLRIAEGGTVLLDEVGDMSLSAQAKALRVIETREAQPLGTNQSHALNIRIIAATNRDLPHLTKIGRFRSDLYFRLNVIRVHLPPLRQRRDDIPHLLNHQLHRLNVSLGLDVQGFTDESMNMLVNYDWPGNVRELNNLVESILVHRPGSRIGVDHLPSHVYSKEETSNAGRERLIGVLNQNGWNKTKAAQQLKWSRMTLYRKMSEYAITSMQTSEPH